MKKLISKLTLSLVLILSFGLNAEAQLAKKGKYSGTCSYSGKVLSMHMQGKAPAMILAEFYGSCLNDAGSGIWHRNSFKCDYSIEVMKMPNTQSNGYCTSRDADGDTMTFRASTTGSLGGPSDAKTKVTNGTGKYKGMTGTGWYRSNPVPAFEQGTFQGMTKFGGSYQIP